MLTFLEYIQETVVYKNQHGQKVFLTKHTENEREHRKWWKDYNDEGFLKFVIPALEILRDKDKKDLKFKTGYAIISKDRTKGFLISLRYNNKTDKNDSFSIATIFNSEAKDAKSDKIFVSGIPDENKIQLKESKEIPILFIVR